MDETIREIALTAPFTTLTSCCSDFLVNQSLSIVARHLDGHGISTKIAGKDADAGEDHIHIIYD